MRIDYGRDALLDDYTKKILRERYMLPSEESPQDTFARPAKYFGEDDAHAQRLYDYASQGWFMYSTPILSNGGTNKGLPISCFLSDVQDSREGLSDHYDENIWLASNGGGIGSNWSNVRAGGTATSRGSSSTGVIPFMHIVDSQMLAVSQGTTRRGSYAAYLDISHPEIEEFIHMRRPTGGDINRRNLNLHHGVNIPDSFMEIIAKAANDPTVDTTWELIDPHSNEIVKVVDAWELWTSLLITRLETGEPYIHFIDRSNEFLPQCQKDLGLEIKQSNLCSEIILPTNADRTAVCCLSSLNLEYFDEWKDTSIIEDVVLMLDNVLSDFIKRTENVKGLRRARFSAMRERSIGLGTMGFHAYLQKNNIPFESALALSKTHVIYKHIREKAEEESSRIGREKGNAPDYGMGEGKRNVHLIAIAPNASSSIICGNTSPSIEPYRANVFSQKTLSGTHIFKNKFLQKVLRDYGESANNNEVWKDIAAHSGSVQHLDWLLEMDKEVFKTALEIDQNWIIEHAAARQKYIDQSQSVNLFFPSNVDLRVLSSVVISAWVKGLKTLYYGRSQAVSRVENINTKFDRHNYNLEGCLACEG